MQNGHGRRCVGRLLLWPVKIVCFGCLIGSSSKRFKRARQPERQPVMTVRDWRCFLSRGESVIGVESN